MKKFTVLCLTFIMAFAALGSISANATTSPKGTQIQIEYLENGDYTETVINDELPDKCSYLTVCNYKNNNKI